MCHYKYVMKCSITNIHHKYITEADHEKRYASLYFILNTKKHSILKILHMVFTLNSFELLKPCKVFPKTLLS